MEAPEGPPRFKCPPGFSACLLGPGGPFSPETLQDPAKELWLIRAPASFGPESLDGQSVSLLGFQTRKVLLPDGTEKIFHIQSALEHLAGAHLLLPAGHGDDLTCSPLFNGSLSISERYGGDHSNNQPLFPVVARPAPQIPEGLKQRFLPFGQRPPLPGAAEEPPRKKRKKKKKHRLEEEDSGEQRPLLGTALGEATGAGEAQPGRWHQVDGTDLLAAGSQPSSPATAQNGEPEGPAPFSKKKKKKRKEDREPKEAARGEAEARPQQENGAALLAASSQPSSAACAQDSRLSGVAEEPDARSKKRRRKDNREVEMGGEAEAPPQREEDGAAPWAVGSPPEALPDSAAFAHNGLLSGEVEAAGPISKKMKKKKRKEDRELEDETRGEAEAASPHQADGTMPQAIGCQPHSAAVAQDSLLFGKGEDPAALSKKKKKKKRKEEGELREEMRAEAEAAHLHKEDGPTLWETDSQPSSQPVAQDGLLSGEAEDPAPISKKKKKKKKRKEDQELEEGAGVEAEVPLDRSSQLGGGSEPHAGGDSLPGMADLIQGTHTWEKKEKAVPSEPLSGQEDAAGMLRDFSGPGPSPEDRLVLAEGEPGVGSSSRKAKNKKRKKEKQELEEGAQEPERWPAVQGVENWAEVGNPLGGGGGQGAEPGTEELSQKHKKKKKKQKEHHRRQAAEEGLVCLEKEVGDS